MKTIPLTRGYFAVIDDADYESVSRFKWFAHVTRYKDGTIKRVQAARQVRPDHDGPQSTCYMHRWLLGITDPIIQVDHRNVDSLDNQRANLRTCSNAQNCRNKRMHRDNRSGYKGVCWQERSKKWVAHITFDGKQRVLGYFSKKTEAARAYNMAAAISFGEFARLNEISGAT